MVRELAPSDLLVERVVSIDLVLLVPVALVGVIVMNIGARLLVRTAPSLLLAHPPVLFPNRLGWLVRRILSIRCNSLLTRGTLVVAVS